MEKHFCAWLRAQGIAHFLPTSHESKQVGRTRYTVDVPLFPGYVFLVGDRDRSTSRRPVAWSMSWGRRRESGTSLERDLWTIWAGGLVTGSRLELTRKLAPGDLVEAKSEPFVGMRGRFEKWGKGGLLHVV